MRIAPSCANAGKCRLRSAGLSARRPPDGRTRTTQSSHGRKPAGEAEPHRLAASDREDGLKDGAVTVAVVDKTEARKG